MAEDENRDVLGTAFDLVEPLASQKALEMLEAIAADDPPDRVLTLRFQACVELVVCALLSQAKVAEGYAALIDEMAIRVKARMALVYRARQQ